MYVTVYIITEWFTEWKFNLKKTPIFGDLYGRVDGIQSSYKSPFTTNLQRTLSASNCLPYPAIIVESITCDILALIDD
jgi:hypothetical protein